MGQTTTGARGCLAVKLYRVGIRVNLANNTLSSICNGWKAPATLNYVEAFFIEKPERGSF